MSEEEKEEERVNNQQHLQKKRLAMSEEEKEQERVNNQQQKRIKQLAMRDEENVGRINRNHHLEDINNDITFELVNELGIFGKTSKEIYLVIPLNFFII